MSGKVGGNWFEVVQHADSAVKEVITVEDGQKFAVRGPVEDVLVVQVSHRDAQEMEASGSWEATLEAMMTSIRGGGFEGGIIVMPEGMSFMKLQKVDNITAKILEQRDQRQRAKDIDSAEKLILEQEDTEEDELSDTLDLHPTTKTKGNA